MNDFLPIGGARGSEIEAGDVALVRIFVHGVHVAFAKEHVYLRVEFDLGTVARIKEHAIAYAHLAHVATGGNDVRPRQASRHAYGCRDKNPGLTAALALGIRFDQEAVVKHPEGKRGCVTHF